MEESASPTERLPEDESPRISPVGSTNDASSLGDDDRTRLVTEKDSVPPSYHQNDHGVEDIPLAPSPRVEYLPDDNLTPLDPILPRKPMDNRSPSPKPPSPKPPTYPQHPGYPTHEDNNPKYENPGYQPVAQPKASTSVVMEPERPPPQEEDHSVGVCGYILIVISCLLLLLFFPIAPFICVKIVQEYERAVIFRLGRILSGGAKGPGIFFIIPCVDNYRKVDIRTVSFDVPPQEILTKDSVTVAVDAVIYFRIFNVTWSVVNVEDVNRSTQLLGATTLRNTLGTKTLSEILQDREHISHEMQAGLDAATDPWGVKVERVEIKDVRLPLQLQRAMAAEAEATRDAKAKVIAAEGEQRASRALKEAADVMAESPSALQLRYLQTLNSISAEKNSTIIFPLPIDMLQGMMKK